MSEWISVKDRLPCDINKNIILTDKEYVFIGFFNEENKFMLNREQSCSECDYFITHWMPLPEPPKCT